MSRPRSIRLLSFTLIFLLLPACCWAQPSRAFRGRPYGVATVTLPARWIDGENNSHPFFLSDTEGRVRYPVFVRGQFLRVVGKLLGIESAGNEGVVTVLFSFEGDEPLQLRAFTPQPASLVLEPQDLPERVHRRFLEQWWREYNAEGRRQQQLDDYPPLIHDYLTSMLGRKLGLRPPLTVRGPTPQDSESFKTLKLLAGAEQLRAAILKRTFAEGHPAGLADTPPPADIHWPSPAADKAEAEEAGAEVSIEPIAHHVPQECFYIRFGKFDNYLWLNNLMDEHGGDISRMVQMRGQNARLDEHMQRQLGLKQSALADLLGGQVISDMAIIGRDAYLREGAAIGLLFEARNAYLKKDIADQRAQTMKEQAAYHPREETVRVAGREVSFISTPDNRMRSFHAVDGKYHLVCTSREIVRRFFEAGEGKDALGASAEFRHARRRLPRARRDTVFAYFSRRFFEGLVSPQYQIELQRRLQAVTDLEILAVARLAGRWEGVAEDTIESLLAAGFLPPNFDRRVDGGQIEMSEHGAIDSLRGARGSFLPITDTPMPLISAREAEQYGAKATYFLEHWKQLDPLMVGVQRSEPDAKGREQVTIDAYISPIEETKYGWLLSVLGPPTKDHLASTPGEVVSVSAYLQGGLLDPTIPPHHLSLGVMDQRPGTDLQAGGLIKTFQILQTTPGYLAAWPKPGYLDRLPFNLGGGPPDQFGYSQLPLGLWRRQFDQYSLLSFDQRVLEQVSPGMAIDEAEQAAQLRVQVRDLSRANIRDWLNDVSYQRARQTTIGNLRLLETVVQQLGEPPERARQTAEALLEAELDCALQGEYELREDKFGRQAWTSTNLTPLVDQGAPDDFEAILLQWFRGLQARVRKTPDGLHLHAELAMQRKPNLSTLFQLFSGKKKTDDEKGAGEQPANAPKTERGREF